MHKSVLEPKCKGFSERPTLGKFNVKPDRQGKKHSPIIRIPTKITNTMKNRRSASNLLRFYPKKTWASAHKLVYLSQYSSCFLWSQARGTFRATTKPSASSCNEIFHKGHFKNNYCGKRRRTSKFSSSSKKLKTEYLFFRSIQRFLSSLPAWKKNLEDAQHRK